MVNEYVSFSLLDKTYDNLRFQLFSDKPVLLDRFDYLHNTVKMNHESILRFPAVLTCRSFRTKQRHEFLCHLDRAQYDPKLPNYVNPLQLIRDSDSHFAVHVAKTSIQEFNNFCKTM